MRALTKFLSRPNIPDAKIRLCAIASGFPEIKAALLMRGVEVIEVEPLAALQPPVRSHADIQLHDLGGGRVVVASDAKKLQADLKTRGFIVTEQKLKEKYPDDIALNCFYLNNKLFCKKESTSKILLNYYQSIGAEIVEVNQGYTKCSTVIVNSSSVITADAGIAKAAKRCGIDVLEVHSGKILLPGYNTGFMGGCCGLISETELAFTGRLSCHADADTIISFCKLKGVDIVELTASNLIDIGGIIPLKI